MLPNLLDGPDPLPPTTSHGGNEKPSRSDSITSSSCVSSLSFSFKPRSALKRSSSIAIGEEQDVKEGEISKRSKRERDAVVVSLSTDSVSVLEFESSCIQSTSVSGVASHSSIDLACSETISSGFDSDDSTCVESDLVVISSDDQWYVSSSSSSDRVVSCSETASLSLSSLIGSSSCYYASSSTEGGGCSDVAWDDRSEPSSAFAQFLQLTLQFTKGEERLRTESLLEFEGRSLVEEEDEESYMRLRGRERNETPLHNYVALYSKMTNHGDLIFTQRSVMINWIFQRCQDMEFQMETLFLGVALMDRFLVRGYFKTERNLQLLGIACITLATRIEENQIRNRLRQRTFTVGGNTFVRSEVVAMEWLVQEVLHFKCLVPTTLNFLWFYLKAAMVGPEVQEQSRLLAVLSLMDHTRLSFWPSTLAAGIVILACLSTGHEHLCNLVMETHMRTKDDDLPECIKSLEWLIQFVCP